MKIYYINGSWSMVNYGKMKLNVKVKIKMYCSNYLRKYNFKKIFYYTFFVSRYSY